MRHANRLKRTLAAGQPALGTWCVLPSAAAANVIAAAGFDFIIVDMEHGPASFETAEDMVRAAETEECTPLVRVPTNQDAIILRALETGAHGIVVPQIVHAADAQQAIASIKYYPEGRRGLSPFTRSAGYGLQSTPETVRRENAETMSVLLVEGVEGIGNLDAIMAVPGIDVIYLGTYDLSQSAGHPGEPDHPAVRGYVEQCVGRIRARGIVPGILAQSDRDLAAWIGLGIRFIAYQADCALLARAAAAVRQAFDRAAAHPDHT